MIKLLNGNCLFTLKEIPDNSIDAIVTDPPYGLSFMGKKWDYDVPSKEIWAECLRVLKPGGHLLSFGGTRTYHRLVVNIEDAGFEIRDQIQWLYGSGFPKSHNIGKAIDKANGVELEVVGQGRSGSSSRAYQSEEKTTAGKYLETKSSNEWQGWGTALKPANEPICVARKPLEKGLTVAENVLKYGTGAINIDASRIGTEEKVTCTRTINRISSAGYTEVNREKNYSMPIQGRWPANLILDETAAEMLDEQSGMLKSGNLTPEHKIKAHEGFEGKSFKMPDRTRDRNFGGDSGGASRFFYVAKASKSERSRGLEGMPKKVGSTYEGNIDHEHGNRKLGANPDRPTELQQNFHPTVKPIKLMSYLIKLVTPPNGTVLDPFMGSGSTGVAAKELGFKFVGIELSEEYFEIAKKRIDYYFNLQQ